MGGSVPELDKIGIKADGNLAHHFRQEIAHLLGRDSVQFPGAQPISFARHHLSELRQRDYYVCEKSDGVRCLLYCTNDGEREIHYLIDRNNDYYYIPGLHFPLPATDAATPIDWALFHVKTILDGEILYDEYPNGKRVLKYLIFDCLHMDGMNLLHRSLDKRLAHFIEKLYKPYKSLCKQFPDDASNFPLFLENKAFELAYANEKMFKETIPRLAHGSDGLIFTCRETPYKFGTDEHILKWKPAEENTIDFKLGLDFPPYTARDDEEEVWENDYNAHPKFTLHVHYSHGDDRADYDMYATEDEWASMKNHSIKTNNGLDGRIIECHKDEQGRWRFNRFRDDKPEANHVSVVRKVLESIEDGVTQDELIHADPAIRQAWKARETQRQTNKQPPDQQQRDMKRKQEEPRQGDEKRQKSEGYESGYE